MPTNRRLQNAPTTPKTLSSVAELPARPDDHRVAAPLGSRQNIETLREAAMSCRACPLWRGATQTVFGEGDPHAALFVVGEQPGNSEDLEGHPFIGPAGRLFESAVNAAGLQREQLYVTNAVKHFKWELRGKRRLHKTPIQKEIEACHPWLETELKLVSPRVVLCLGATAARAILGGPVRIGEHRGKAIALDDRQVVVTIHPAYVLRLRGAEAQNALEMLAADTALAAKLSAA